MDGEEHTTPPAILGEVERDATDEKFQLIHIIIVDDESKKIEGEKKYN